MLFDHIVSKYEKGLSLLEMLQTEAVLKKLPLLYVPEVQTYDNGDMFLNNGGSVYIKESGPTKIRFILFDKNGNTMTEPGSSYTRFIKNRAKYLARLSCSSIGRSAPNVTLDYFVDIDKIQFQPQSAMFSQERVRDDKSKVTEIIEDYKYLFISVEAGMNNCTLISQFEMNREQIFNDYF